VLSWRIGSVKEKGRRNIKEGKKKRRTKGTKIKKEESEEREKK
jgi:hypothetical protein